MKLFKTLRQTFIKQGSLKRYLLYAIGEILLVMIGISLAFQLDNWNDNRIKENAEIKYYENIKGQISDDKELIHSQKDFNNHFMAQFKYANEIIEANDRSKLDTLGMIVRNLTQYSDFDRQGNIYETMVNSGQINLLQNHKIVNGIRELEERYIYINRMEENHFKVILQFGGTFIIDNINFSTGEVENPEEIYSFKFQNRLLAFMIISEEKDVVYHRALIEIDAISELIERELQ